MTYRFSKRYPKEIVPGEMIVLSTDPFVTLEDLIGLVISVIQHEDCCVIQTLVCDSIMYLREAIIGNRSQTWKLNLK